MADSKNVVGFNQSGGQSVPPAGPTGPDKRQAAEEARTELDQAVAAYERAAKAFREAEADLKAKRGICAQAYQAAANEAKQKANELAAVAKKALDAATAGVIEATQLETEAKILGKS